MEKSCTIQDVFERFYPSYEKDVYKRQAKYVGRAPIQVDAFLKNVVQPILDDNKEILGMTDEINV